MTSSSALRAHWKDGSVAFGGWCATGSVLAAQALAWQGFDYVAVDCQHSLLGHDTLRECVTALAGSGTVPVVRVPENDGGWIRRAVACGAQGVIVPQIESAGAAAEAVQHCRLAHAERRHREMLGVGSGNPSENAGDSVVCVLMVESAIGIKRITDICGVEGIDGVYVGPRDLAITYGLAPMLELQRGPHAEAARIVLEACHANHLVAGIHCESGVAARQLARDGFQMITISSDQQFIRTAAAAALGHIRAAQLRHDSVRAADDRGSGT